MAKIDQVFGEMLCSFSEIDKTIFQKKKLPHFIFIVSELFLLCLSKHRCWRFTDFALQIIFK